MTIRRLNALQEQRADKVKELRALIDKVDASGEDLTDEQEQQKAAMKAEIDRLDTRIKEEQELEEYESSLPAKTGTDITGGEPRIEEDPKRGFESYGEFLKAVHKAAPQVEGTVDDRLKIGAAPTTNSNEGTGADGGYLVPPEFAREVRGHALSQDSIVPMTDNNPVSGNGMVFPADETTPWGSDGVRAYWEAEANQATQAKLKLKERSLRLRKLFSLVPVTNELLADAATLSNYLARKTGESIRWKTNDALVNGNGGGVPLGIFNANALVTVAKEGSQAADTVNANNVSKMYSRNTNPTRAVWMVHHTVYPQLLTISVSNQPVWAPNFEVAPGGTLFGRPVFIMQTCQTLGDKGDIYFADWMSYVTITKQAGIQFDTSMHLWFDYDTTAFRAIYRIDGQPWLDNAVSPANGSASMSPFVTLAERA